MSSEWERRKRGKEGRRGREGTMPLPGNPVGGCGVGGHFISIAFLPRTSPDIE